MGNLWFVFCGESNCDFNLTLLTNPSSCINNALTIFLDAFLLIAFFIVFISKKPLKINSRGLSSLQLVSAVYNVILGSVNLIYGAWVLEENSNSSGSWNFFLPLHSWVIFVFHGFVWLLVGLTVSLKGHRFSRALSISAFVFTGIIFGLSFFNAIVLEKKVSIKTIFDVGSFVGSCLLISCAYRGYRDDDDDEENEIFDPLLKENRVDQNVTPFTKAGFLSTFTFWWLNPLMKTGKEKTLEDEDIPKLRMDDRAESCYSLYLNIYSHKKKSILKTIFTCYWKEIFISGFFAFLKVVTISLGPLLLKAFIAVVENEESFEHERYLLVVTLFFTKILESVSQRQWYFRSRLVGLKIRSLLTAAVYKKQLKLSNSAKLEHSSGEIMNYVTVDCYRIGEFPFWFHQIWTTTLQLCFAILILFQSVGPATISSIIVIFLTVFCNMPIAKLQHKFQTKLMEAQDERLKLMNEALVNMKVLKLYAWEIHFMRAIEKLRLVEDVWLRAVQLRKAYNSFLFWCSPVLVSAATFGTCYVVGVKLTSSNVFTFVATLRLVQDPVRSIPDVVGVFIQAKVAFVRIVRFLEAKELESSGVRKELIGGDCGIVSVLFESADLSWDEKNAVNKATVRDVSLEVKRGEKIAVCGEVGSGKSTLLAAILGEVPITKGNVQVHGTIAYVSQSAWIQTGTIRENILFGSSLNNARYQDTLERCSLVKDLELLPYGDLTEIGERGVNLSGGQKQRIQLARALYSDADIYLLDDPFSAVDAQTATSLFCEYVMGALAKKTVLLVTHQVDFLPAFDSILLMSDGEILHAAPYNEMIATSQEFRDLINAHKETAGTERLSEVTKSSQRTEPSSSSSKEIHKAYAEKKAKKTPGSDQLIKKEERETGDTGFKPYIIYLKQNRNRGFLIFSMAAMCHLTFVIGQIIQNSWMAANVDDPNFSTLRLILVYLLIGVISSLFLLTRTLTTVVLGMQSSRALFSKLLVSLFRAPMSFYDSTPLGRILSRVSVDLSIVDLDIPFNLVFTFGSTTNCYSNLVVLAVITWQVLFVSIPMIYLAIRLQKYYYASAKELMRINGTTKSFVANHLAESVAGATTIRAFKEEDRFFAKNLELIDTNASPFFHYFSANEWLIQRLETLSAAVLSFAGLCMVLLPSGTFSSGFIGMALSYGLSLNMSLVFSINNQCMLANYIISVERLDQYMHIASEAPEVIEDNRPPVNWPAEGKVEIQDLKIRYRADGPLVLSGITCKFEGGHKIGIVGRTGSGKTTLIGALFRLVEPSGGKILVDGVDISTIGLHDLRSRFGIIPQDPTLFTGTVRYNLDPLCQHSDEEIWEVLGKCQLKEAVHEKEGGLDSPVVEDGSNWSMGQRQLFCLGRALLRRSKILVLDEATASIDNATDMILQKTIRNEFADCTVITVAHRIPTVMDSTMVLSISDGKLVEYDEPMKLIKREDSLFGQLVKEYWSNNNHSVESQ
ncbi:multidrug resistance protein ABC transporter [Striga asiatica]|uniref:ABC-type xenobiotic transporter n=1 Tax=Striga asiatica TaxID=4170 RepID=A0A5A7QND9_STRAF|nr:multidrug resistance protein ABC transporter [Striga asiatica]